MTTDVPCKNCITKPMCRLKFSHEVFRCPLLLAYTPNIKIGDLYDFRRDVYLHLEPVRWAVNKEGKFMNPGRTNNGS